jgi:hypothetical protein
VLLIISRYNILLRYILRIIARIGVGYSPFSFRIEGLVIVGVSMLNYKKKDLVVEY